MIYFNNDYSRGAHPAILKAMEEINDTSFSGYGTDELCLETAELIKQVIKNDNVDVHFMVGGTPTNFVFASSVLRHYEGIICADTGHINAHETGAIERAGFKCLALPNTDAKISAEQIADAAQAFVDSPIQEHIIEPKLVYITYPTELGTIYSRKELEDIKAVCEKYGLYLYIDGARLSYGLAASTDMDLPGISSLCDAFYIGGTKCGAMIGEALIIINDDLKPHFRCYMKQHGAMLAKGWIIAIQFKTLLTDGLYVDIAKNAIEGASRIRNAFLDKGCRVYIDSPTNQQFIVLTTAQRQKLEKKYVIEEWEKLEEDVYCMRFCTAWFTKKEEIDELISDIENL